MAYLLSFRTYVTCLHGDSRGSTDRHHNTYRCRRLAPDQALRARRKALLRQAPVVLDAAGRRMVEATASPASAAFHFDPLAANHDKQAHLPDMLRSEATIGCQADRLLVHQHCTRRRGRGGFPLLNQLTAQVGLI